jgi:hypothetical protein
MPVLLKRKYYQVTQEKTKPTETQYFCPVNEEKKVLK